MNNIIMNSENLSKQFDKTMAVSNFSIQIEKGEIYGILGANGAGKTTLFKLLSGLLEPTEGSTFVLGQNPWNSGNKILNQIGLLIESPYFYEHLTANENLEIHLEYMNTSGDITLALEQVGLKNIENKKVSKFSMGMRQRLAIARAIVHNPSILILDEPINGLDPVGIQDMRELFTSLSKEGITILLSSHILSEILSTANHLIIMANGRLIETKSILEYQERYRADLENHLIKKMRGEY